MSFVSYSHNKLCKTLTVPEINGDFHFSASLDTPHWQQHPQWTSDFHTIYSPAEYCDKVSFALLQDADNLYIGFKIALPRSERRYPAPDSIWSGEMIELHFGALAPDPWLLQFGIGINSSRFDSSGAYDKWQAEIFENDDCWGGVVKVSLTMLKIADCGVSFNFCGQLCQSNTSFTWTKLLRRFHEVENFGLLLFTDYAQAAKLRCNMSFPVGMTREEFELMTAQLTIPAGRITHGPYTVFESNTSVAVLWETAGMVPAFLEYRASGDTSTKRRVLCDMNNAVMKHQTNHYALLQDLTPGVEYEYELFSLAPVSDNIESSGITGKITMPQLDEDNLNFYCVSDLHSNAGFLSCAMQTPEAAASQLKILLGDNLSHAAGREALYAGVIDPIVNTGNTAPLLFVRGNHEQLGIFASEYFNVMRQSDGKTYRFMRYGKIAFIILDSGNDHADPPHTVLFDNTALRNEQYDFLKKVVSLEEYQSATARIVLMHIPPYRSDVPGEVDVHKMLEPLCSAKFKPHVMLCGHIHQYLTVAADADTYTDRDAGYARQHPEVMPLPFPSVVCSTSMALAGSINGKRLTIRAMLPESGTRESDHLTIEL